MAIVSNVVILARTKMNDNRVCIGGYSLFENRYIRLLVKENESYSYQPRIKRRRAVTHLTSTMLKNMKQTEPYQIGEMYSIEYEHRDKNDISPPHYEDVIVLSKQLKFKPNNYNEFLDFLGKIAITGLHIKNLFNGLLQWQNESGFLVKNQNLPPNSVVVATLSHDLYLSKRDDDYYYYIDNILKQTFKVKYVGVDDKKHIKKIPAGSFLRFSLARWWDNQGNFSEKRSYLQLSAIY